jgi:hypothetical protein
LALDRRVSYCHRHLADLSQVVRAIPPVKVETGRGCQTTPLPVTISCTSCAACFHLL